MWNTRLKDSSHVNSYGSLYSVFETDLHKREPEWSIPALKSSRFFFSESSAEFHKNTAGLQEHNSEHQNLMITAFLKSWAFCGQYYKHLKVKWNGLFCYIQSNILFFLRITLLLLFRN